MKAIQQAIHIFGSQAALASVLTEHLPYRISQQRVWNWLHRGDRIGADQCLAIERATNGAVTRQELRPNDWHLIWPELRQQEVEHV